MAIVSMVVPVTTNSLFRSVFCFGLFCLPHTFKIQQQNSILCFYWIRSQLFSELKQHAGFNSFSNFSSRFQSYFPWMILLWQHSCKQSRPCWIVDISFFACPLRMHHNFRSNIFPSTIFPPNLDSSFCFALSQAYPKGFFFSEKQTSLNSAPFRVSITLAKEKASRTPAPNPTGTEW